MAKLDALGGDLFLNFNNNKSLLSTLNNKTCLVTMI